MPMLRTTRLLLRALKPADAQTLHALTNHSQISANMQDMPYPYPEEGASNMIDWSREAAARGDYYAFGIVRREDNQLLGVVFIKVDNEHRRGELGFWLGVAYWGQGYMTEAAARLLVFAFTRLSLNRVHAFCFGTNQAAISVLEKIGLKREAILRQEVLQAGQWRDIHCYGLLHTEFEAE